ncbi:hypothetical protein [Ruficoccus sp. ZRK36]|uniref:hypothetical protein n=1 Tax=Ruficoccus sp. ZRK36 TaxID=2866311 RepID=UPI001C73D7B3|nr:hypothetical protein [Ruficoccus sp. ZRK36]QYY34935.1 hypothetical protein K0V07_11555 [Ruficoccus sp. ZRK36]
MRCLLVLLIFILSSAVSHAALSIVINIESKTLKIEGEDSGTAANVYYVNPPIGAVKQVFWAYSGTTGSLQILDVQSCIEQSVNSAEFRIYSDGGLSLLAYSQDSSLAEINGNSSEISYATLDASYQSILESSNGLSLSLDEGIIYSSVQMTVVPEPLHYTTIAGLFALCGILGVRHQRRHLS